MSAPAPTTAAAVLDAERMAHSFQASICALKHGGPLNSAEVYGHPGSRRTCVRVGNVWLYGIQDDLAPWLLVEPSDANHLDYITAADRRKAALAEPIAQALAAVEAVARVEALVESWPHGASEQEYRRAVTQCRAAVLAALRPSDGA